MPVVEGAAAARLNGATWECRFGVARYDLSGEVKKKKVSNNLKILWSMKKQIWRTGEIQIRHEG